MSGLSRKEALRSEFSAIRAAIPARTAAEAKMTKRLLSHPEFLAADSVLCFVSFGSEPGTRQFLNACFRMQKKVAVPRCEPDGRLRFFRVSSLDALCPAPPYGIPEPSPLEEEATVSARTFCVVPGLAFDKNGYRLGYGGGYYDRFLAGFPGKTAGLCFQACLTDRLPRGAHDWPVQSIITEQTMIRR